MENIELGYLRALKKFKPGLFKVLSLCTTGPGFSPVLGARAERFGPRPVPALMKNINFKIQAKRRLLSMASNHRRLLLKMSGLPTTVNADW